MLTPDDVPHTGDLVTIDVAFISLRHILPALPPFLDPGADIVALVKPQFEAGRDEVGKHGIVSDPAVHEAVIARVTEAAQACGLARIAMAPSPITGATGNQEFFLHLHAPLIRSSSSAPARSAASTPSSSRRAIR